MTPESKTRIRPDDIPPRAGLRWRAQRRDIYEEEGYIIESISKLNPPNSPPYSWTLRGHWTRDELAGLREVLDEILS